MNKDWKRRDFLVGITDDWDSIGGDVHCIGPIDKDLLKTIIKEDFIDIEEYQNSGPTVKEILSLMEKYDGITAYGYAVSPHRPDYRITLDEIRISGEPAKKLIEKYANPKNRLEELVETASYHGKHFDNYRLWWD